MGLVASSALDVVAAEDMSYSANDQCLLVLLVIDA